MSVRPLLVTRMQPVKTLSAHTFVYAILVMLGMEKDVEVGWLYYKVNS